MSHLGKNSLDFTICGLSFLRILATANIQEDSEPGGRKTPAQGLCLCCYKAGDTEAQDAVKEYVLYLQQK